ncbi:hypothetical protein Rpal_3361 [Rhodopseudomonas palustris TIE-1]|uniref:helix-turn-helix domain-containing protein n=1 Tax=Rhodopseudomonas palustris TaxID=1076 RepID=UPI0001779759|nr:helix-turn-helix transcriptional regulator [Rhodopseudomonas palustris]ACF01863.1 hypothetical protein Rpal_3361 [Rhodopseudomonas palustris TIE-1]
MIKVRDIRTKVFKVTQAEMAGIAGVQQPTISRWESSTSRVPAVALAKIREEAKARGLRWDDRWAFGGAVQTGAKQRQPRKKNRVRP